MNYAYTASGSEGRKKAVKVPAWLNDVRYYHNRGNTTFTKAKIRSWAILSGLTISDTENPRVVKGFIDIYGGWIDRFGIDGFRIDTAKHVNPRILGKALRLPCSNARRRPRAFRISTSSARWRQDGQDTRIAGAAYPGEAKAARHPCSILYLDAGQSIPLAGRAGTDMLATDCLRTMCSTKAARTTAQAASDLPWQSRRRALRHVRECGWRIPRPTMPKLLKRVLLRPCHADDFTIARSCRPIYSGDEQGFVGDGNDQDSAREDMFPSKVAVYNYNDNRLLGTKAPRQPTVEFRHQKHPLYTEPSPSSGENAPNEASSALAARRNTVVRNYAEKPGLFAFSRASIAKAGEEVLTVFNTSNAPLSGQCRNQCRRQTKPFVAPRPMPHVTPRAPGLCAV